MDGVGAASDGLRAMLESLRPSLPYLAVALVISERSRTPVREDYVGFSVAASFLESLDIAEIVRALRASSAYVHHFNDEIAFMTWASTVGIASMPRAHHIVYTSAVNGVGPGRRSLVPAFCALQRIPTVNSDAYSCAINRHKYHWNTLLRAFGFPVPRCWSIDPEFGWHLDRRPQLGETVIGKATYEGSSIGLNSDTVGAFSAQMEARFRDVGRALRQPLTVQQLVVGDEFEVPVIEMPDGYVAPAAIEIRKSDGSSLGDRVLTYADVWDDSYRFEIADSTKSTEAMRAVAVGVAKSLGFRGFSRIDFRVGNEGPLVIDVSSTPHLTKATSFATLFAEMGFSYEDMWALLVGMAAHRHDMI